MKRNKVAPGSDNRSSRASLDKAHSGTSVGRSDSKTRKLGITSSQLFSTDDESKQQSSGHRSHGPTLRAILPQIMNEQNRKTFGTWQRQFDFTRTIVGYLIGIHNFYRFPYLVYKFGGVFFIPYIIMIAVVGIPVVFLEFTIGQYYGVGSYVAFTHMSPLLNGVSKLLTWSCIVNCWMYTVIMAWLRIYSTDTTSCLKGWEICEENNYYNTPHCFTGSLDDNCNDFTETDHNGVDISELLNNQMLFYNFHCITVTEYCELNGWTLYGDRDCKDSSGKKRSIYERRFHAAQEFFYGKVLGLQRNAELIRDKVLVDLTLSNSGATSVVDIVDKIFAGQTVDAERLKQEKQIAQRSPMETVNKYLRKLKSTDPSLYKTIKDSQVTKQYQDQYWEKNAQRLVEDRASSSDSEIQSLSLSTWVMIAVFLFEDLLKLSFLSYVLNAVPFVILIIVTIRAFAFPYAGYGMEQIFASKDGFFNDLSRLDIWCEATIQVMYTTGIGNGVLISLATFNNPDHQYTFDLYATLMLSVITSCCGVLITFCSLGHYLKQHNIDVPFREYFKSQSTTSVEFCSIIYSIFLTIISDQSVMIILFFFMVTSFATDTTVRLVQNVLDTVMDISTRFKHHSAMVLVAVCSMGYLSLVPMMKNGSFFLFVDFEYFTIRYMIPTIVILELGSCVFIYKAVRIMDHSEQMGINSTYTFRTLMTACMYLAFFAILTTTILNIVNHENIRFNGVEAATLTEIFGWVFFLSPLLTLLLSIIKQLIVVPPSRWRWLLMPLGGKDRRGRRFLLKRLQEKDGQDDGGYRTDQEEIRDAAKEWRKLESNLILQLMKRRKEEKDTENMESTGRTNNAKEDQTPILVSLVRLAAAAKKEDEQIFRAEKSGAQEQKVGDDDDEEDDDFKRAHARNRRLGFVHGKKETFMSHFVAAFWGKAARSGKFLRPKRHAGGGAKKRIVTRSSSDGSKIMHLENMDDDEEQISEESVSHDDEDVLDEKLREKYLNAMDYVERWPGRLDESEIESEGSSVEDDIEEVDEVF